MYADPRDTNTLGRPSNKSTEPARSTDNRRAVGRLLYLKSMGAAGSSSSVERIDL